jgi:hypothetical protein
MREKEKKKEVEGLLGSMPEERFALLVNLGKKITDWVQEEKMQLGLYWHSLFYIERGIAENGTFCTSSLGP